MADRLIRGRNGHEPTDMRAPSREVDRFAAAAAGEPEAVRWLLDDVAPIVYGFVFARVGGDEGVAEDLLQETLVEAIRSAPTFRGDALLSTWMCAIARRRVARHFEAERRRDVARQRAQAAHLGAVEDPGVAASDRDHVIGALGRLKPLHRQVLVFKYLDDRSVAEIADELGSTTTRVQSLLQRARDGLRRELGIEATT